MKNTNIELIVHLKNNKFFKLANVLNSVTWSGDIKSPSRKLEFSILQTVFDNKVQNIGISVGDTVCFYVDDSEIFRGTIIDVDKSSADNNVKVTAYDIGHYLSKDEISMNFNAKSVTDIAKAIFKGNNGQQSLPYSHIAQANTLLTKLYIGVNRYEAIMDAYTEHSKKDPKHKKYMIEVDLDKFRVIEKGIITLKVQFQEGKNIESTSYKESIEDMVSRVLVVDDKGNKIKVKEDKELRKLYYYITKVIEQKKDSPVTDEEIKEAIKGLDRSCTLEGYGDISCKCGYKVQVKDSATGLIGDFYIDSDKHTWIGGKYSIRLDLNFENIMDEKSINNDKKGKSLGSGIDWGHGVTAEMMNKVLKGPLAGKGDLFVKWGNAYGVNPMLVAMIIRIESKPTMNSGLALKGNNFGGIRPIKGYPKITLGGSSYAKFPSVEVGIEEQFRLLGVRYLHDWKKKSLEEIINTYAPASDGNNPKQYVSNLKKFYKENTGKTWSNKLLGSGVSSKEEAHSRLSQGAGQGISSDKQRIIMQTAESMIGKGKYTWGGKSIYASDCSGFVYCCHKAAGIKIGGSTASQIHNGVKIPSLSQALPGDLIVTQSSASGSGRHVVLYAGGGLMIHNGGPAGRPITKEKLRLGKWYEIRRCW